MDKTKIDWCDASWNPITGCHHGCKYCYAKRIVDRFKTAGVEVSKDVRSIRLDAPILGDGKHAQTYPFGFIPTFHAYRLDVPKKWTRPRTIFVCSMADMFGSWISDDWIKEILEACRRAPQHRYLFLTKNPKRYDDLEDKGIIRAADTNFWLGSTVIDMTKDYLHYSNVMHTFQSCEPMLKPWPPAGEPNRNYEELWPEWVIFGAETGNRKGKVVPEKQWVDNAVQMCRNINAKVFMKESLREIMGSDFVQEYPWE